MTDWKTVVTIACLIVGGCILAVHGHEPLAGVLLGAAAGVSTPGNQNPRPPGVAASLVDKIRGAAPVGLALVGGGIGTLLAH